MTAILPDAYCFFQEIEPCEPMIARFDRDYLLHAVKGALNVEIDGKRWLLPGSFAAWVPANTGIRVVLDRPVTSCSILVKPGFASALPKRPVVFQMSRLAREMALHCRGWRKEDTHPPEATVFFNALLAVCAGLTENAIDVARPSSADPQLSKAIAFIENNLDQTLTTSEIACACGMSERTMQRKFSAELGASWRQTLTHARMIRAIELLTRDELSIIRIAGECGYASMSAFNRSFRGYAGVTPTEFRRQLS